MSLRILLVEDDKHVRQVLESLIAREPGLASRRPEIVCVQGGREGLAALEGPPFDLVISDLVLPRMDGLQFCRELRRHRQGVSVPLLVTSALYQDAATLDQLRADTGAEFFIKPYQMQELVQAVRRLLTGEPAPTAGRRPGEAQRGGEPGAAQQAGSIAERPVPQLLLDLWEQRATGTLTLLRGKIKKKVTLLHGTPVSADSNLRTETLGHFLVTRGVLSEKRHQLALARAQETKDRLGRVVVSLGWLTEHELMRQLAAQVRYKIINVLRWKDGDWVFSSGQPSGDRMQLPIEAPLLVLGGLKRTARVDEIAQALADQRGRVVLTLRAERHRETMAKLFGAKLLEQLGRRPTVGELMSGVDPTTTLVALEALFTAGLAEVERGARTAMVQPAPQDPISLGRIVHAVETTPTNSAAPGSLYEELFGEPSPEPTTEGTAMPSDELSGVMELPSPDLGRGSGQAAERGSGPVADAEALRREVLSEYLAIHGKDFYQVLGVAPDAAPMDIAEAYAGRGKSFRLERFADVDLGPDYARLEEIHQLYRQAFETLSALDRRSEYDRLLERRARPTRAPLDAELWSHEAITLLATGDAAGARARLEQAVAADPEQADYHALLGWAVFASEGGTGSGRIAEAAALAWPHLDRAFSIDADHLDAHDFAGRIAAAAGDDERARVHVQRVLDADPTRVEALAAFESVCGRSGDWKLLERQYRKLIHRLSSARAPERALRLWWRLAELYRHRLDDRAAAQTAYEIVARLAPDDPRPHEALARLHAEDAAGWAKAAQALRDSWQLQPEDDQAGRTLLQLHLDGERWDAAFLASAALVCRDGAESAQQLYRRHRARFLPRTRRALDPGLRESLRHPEDDPALAELFGQIFAVHGSPFRLEDLGVAAGDRLEPTALPEPFSRVLRYVADQLGVAVPPVYRHPDFGPEVHVGAAGPGVLLAGAQALALEDPLELAFRLGRALSFLFPGRAVAGALPPGQLKASLLAALTWISPAVRAEDPEGEIAAIRAKLAAVPGLDRALAPLVERILAQARTTLNLSRYTRGMARTAERIGLVLADDLPCAHRVVAQGSAAGAADELLDFALSEAYLAVREALGLSIAV